MIAFSIKQQQILGIFCAAYGVYLLIFLFLSSAGAPEASTVPQPDPPDLLFYLEPPVDINTADSPELRLLPGIGPVLAERIIDYRRLNGSFHAAEELDEVYGIGPKTIQKIRPYLLFSQ